MIISKIALAVAQLASTTDDTRYSLNGVLVEPDGTVVATDGRMMLLAKDTATPDDAEFPIVPAAPYLANPAKGVLVPVAVVTAMIATMPKKTTLPILQSVQLSTVADRPESVTVSATDLTAPRTAMIDLADGRTFPTYTRVIPPTDRPEIRVCLDVAFLERLCKAAKLAQSGRANGRDISITFGIPTAAKDLTDGVVISSVRLTLGGSNVTVTGVIMPIHL